MGVRGLQSFLKENKDSLGDVVLLNKCNLVIDANNLLCLLFAKLALDKRLENYRNDIYTGDLVAYAKALREFFANLDKCNITPILIFDGCVVGKLESKDFVANKEATVYKRGLSRFESAKRLTETSALEGHNDDDLFLPQQLNIVFRVVVNELGIQRIQSPYEADTHIARVANDLNCYALTNDSDFIIYDLKKGFILIDFFNYKEPIVDRNGQTCIDCVAFSQARLSKAVPGLRKENMPLLSVLLGNDYVEAGTFDRVTASICNKYYDGHLRAKTFSHKRIANLLLWLRHRSLQEAIDYVLHSVHPNYQSKLQACILMFLRNYKIEEEENFNAELGRVYPRSSLNPNTKPEHEPATFIHNLLETKAVSSTILDFVFKSTHYNYSLLDDYRLPTSSQPMFRAYSLAIVLLRPVSYANLTTNARKIRSEEDAFIVYDRVELSYSKIVLRPLEVLENFGSLENLDCYSMIQLDPALKKNILMSTFRFNSEEMSLLNETLALVFKEPALSESVLCFIIIKYIVLETGISSKSEFVDALLLTHFYYAAISGQLVGTDAPDEACGKLLLRIRPHTTKNNFRDNTDNPILYRRVMHMLGQVQSTYKGFNLINTLLCQVLSPPRHDLWYNGPLIYRLTKLLKLEEFSMEDLCHGIPSLLDASVSLHAQVYSE